MPVEADDTLGIHTSNLPHPLYAESDQRGPSASPRSNICGLGTTVLPRVFVFGNYHDEIIGANFNTTPPTGGKVLWGGGRGSNTLYLEWFKNNPLPHIFFVRNLRH